MDEIWIHMLSDDSMKRFTPQDDRHLLPARSTHFGAIHIWGTLQHFQNNNFSWKEPWFLGQFTDSGSPLPFWTEIRSTDDCAEDYTRFLTASRNIMYWSAYITSCNSYKWFPEHAKSNFDAQVITKVDLIKREEDAQWLRHACTNCCTCTPLVEDAHAEV